jgi:Kef-type K+ transport system membrane component KefB
MKKSKDAKKIKVLGITVKPKNKIYWFEGVTEQGVKSLLADENSKFKWLRPQRNRRVLVALMVVGLITVSMGSYWPTLKTNLNLSDGTSVVIYSVTAIFVIFAVLVGYLFLRISVRGIGDAPNELLDERQIKVRDTSFRYAYYAMGYVVLGLLLLMLFGPELKMFQPEGNDGSYLIIATLFAFSSMPSMVLAWRERDI